MATYIEVLTSRFGESDFRTSEFRDNKRLHVPPEKLFAYMKVLKEDCGFDYLAEVGGIDYLHYPDATDRYAVIYGLANTNTSERVFVKVALNDPDPTVESLYPLWKGADWMEREVFDMYGILFAGHPDLRRILMPEASECWPLRKDYPLRGRGERHNFPVITRAES